MFKVYIPLSVKVLNLITNIEMLVIAKMTVYGTSDYSNETYLFIFEESDEYTIKKLLTRMFPKGHSEITFQKF
tara:strand:+ start:7726 stop:7944 length:219 start_codon:yes stop_codon:yes gene_type:complete